MEDRTAISQIDESYIQKELVICGRVIAIKAQKNVIFVKLADSGKSQLKPLQIVFSLTPGNTAYYHDLTSCCTGCTLMVSGVVVKSPAKGQQFEMAGTKYTIIGTIDDPMKYPLTTPDLTSSFCKVLIV